MSAMTVAAVGRGIVFVEGKFIAHADVWFAHSVSIISHGIFPHVRASLDAGNYIIIQSSNIKR
jgi:hypothetical protein